MSHERLQDALCEGERLMPYPAHNARQSDAEWLTAQQLAERTSIPASWWQSQAKSSAIPSRMFGKYRRFPRSILDATNNQCVAEDSKPATARLSAVRD